MVTTPGMGDVACLSMGCEALGGSLTLACSGAAALLLECRGEADLGGPRICAELGLPPTAAAAAAAAAAASAAVPAAAFAAKTLCGRTLPLP